MDRASDGVIYARRWRHKASIEGRCQRCGKEVPSEQVRMSWKAKGMVKRSVCLACIEAQFRKKLYPTTGGES